MDTATSYERSRSGAAPLCLALSHSPARFAGRCTQSANPDGPPRSPRTATGPWGGLERHCVLALAMDPTISLVLPPDRTQLPRSQLSLSLSLADARRNKDEELRLSLHSARERAVRRATREGKGRSPGVRVRARRRSGEELLELARLVQGLEVRVAADVLAADEDRGDGALPSLVAEVGLPVGAVLLQIELVQVEVLALLLEEGLGTAAMRAIALGEDDDALARGDGGFCGRRAGERGRGDGGGREGTDRRRPWRPC